jgi:hypothetical protein
VDELEHFLAGEPIHAQRPTLAERGLKWARRHKAIVWAVGVVLLLSMTGLAASTLLIAHEQEETAKALTKAKEQKTLAEKNLDKSIALLETVLKAETGSQPGTQAKRIAEETVQFLQSLLSEHGDNPRIRLEAASTYRRLGFHCQTHIPLAIGEERLSLKALGTDLSSRAFKLAKELVNDFPQEPRFKLELARQHFYHGWRCREAVWESVLPEKTHLRQEAVSHLKQAAQMYEDLLREYQKDMEFRNDLILIHDIWSSVLRESDDHRGARIHILAAIDQAKALLVDFPGIETERGLASLAGELKFVNQRIAVLEALGDHPKATIHTGAATAPLAHFPGGTAVDQFENLETRDAKRFELLQYLPLMEGAAIAALALP